MLVSGLRWCRCCKDKCAQAALCTRTSCANRVAESGWLSSKQLTQALCVQQLLTCSLQVALGQQGAAEVEGHLEAGPGRQLERGCRLGQVR